MRVGRLAAAILVVAASIFLAAPADLQEKGESSLIALLHGKESLITSPMVSRGYLNIGYHHHGEGKFLLEIERMNGPFQFETLADIEGKKYVHFINFRWKGEFRLRVRVSGFWVVFVHTGPRRDLRPNLKPTPPKSGVH